MSAIPAETLTRTIVELFTEAYAGSPHSYTWFISNGPNAALLDTLAGVSAEEASKPVAAGGTSIASHAEHLRWSLAMANAFARGEKPESDWEKSWTVREVTPEEWDKLRADLKSEFETLRTALSALKEWPEGEFFQGVLALIPHAAYHLGAIKQMVPRAKSESS